MPPMPSSEAIYHAPVTHPMATGSIVVLLSTPMRRREQALRVFGTLAVRFGVLIEFRLFLPKEGPDAIGI